MKSLFQALNNGMVNIKSIANLSKLSSIHLSTLLCQILGNYYKYICNDVSHLNAYALSLLNVHCNSLGNGKPRLFSLGAPDSTNSTKACTLGWLVTINWSHKIKWEGVSVSKCSLWCVGTHPEWVPASRPEPQDSLRSSCKRLSSL